MAEIQDNGPNPYAVNIEEVTLENENFRTALWTGEEFQITLMEIPVGGDVGLEVHTENDQFLRLEQGKGLAKMGPAKDNFTFERNCQPTGPSSCPRACGTTSSTSATSP